MAAPVMLRSNFSDFFGTSALPVLEEIFWSEQELHPSRREMLFKTVSSDRDIYQVSAIHDMELFSQVSEGSEPSFRRPKQGASKTFTATKFALGFSISEEMIDDGKYDFVADAIKKLSQSARETKEIAGMNIFNNGFSSETTSDGVAVFSASHTLPSGGSLRNKLSTDADLSTTSLDQMLQDFETQFVGDSGILHYYKPKVLLVPSGLKRYANEIVKSSQKADTADNNMNPFTMDDLMVVSSPHLTDPDAWFLLAQPSDTGLRVIERKALSTQYAPEGVGWMSDSVLYKAKYRESIGVTEPYGVFGTQGA